MEVLIALARAAETGLMPTGARILLAVSGGADSMALLYGAAEEAPWFAWSLAVGHVQHGWRGREAERDLAFVRTHASRLCLPFLSRRKDAREASRRWKLSPEAGARYARYEALREMAQESESARIATAHQRDDALESYLIARERRGGLALLGGPRERRADGVVRPLLAVTREEILRFLAARALSHRRDSSNGNLRLLRNRIRREVLAPLKEADDHTGLAELGRRADLLREARDRMDREFEERVRPYLFRQGDAVAADAAFLQGCAAELQRRALEEAALPFAAPGRPPMTGREREQIRSRLETGADFRFEAGRRIRFERRGARLRVSLSGRSTRPDGSRQP
jgi:tRNA(Ile)-lysidine synthase